MHTYVRALMVLVLICAEFAAHDALAQSTTGRISGTVLDISNAVLPGVTVTLTEENTGLTRTTTTDPVGAYVFVSLPVGSYTVTAELEGFRKASRSGLQLVADGRVTADFVLQVGAMSELIEVAAAGETVNTVSGEMAKIVDREQVQNLALNGRNYMQLATLIPGSPVLNDNALNIMTDLGINTSINGSRTNQSLLTVDGGFNMDSGSNNSQISNVGIDFIEEVSIKTANFSAEYGRNSGAAINVVTRSGSNQLKGSLFEYVRNDRFDSNDYFNSARGVAKAPLRYNDYGYSLGGPIQKNKLFFFGGEEWKKIRRFSTPTPRTVPTTAMMRGDFSALSAAIKDPRTGQPFPGNIIPPNRITADGRAIANVYSAMIQKASSFTDSPISNNALFQGPNPFDFRQDMFRADYQATSAQRLTFRAILDNYNLNDPFGAFITSQLPTSPNNRIRPGRNFQLSHNWTIGTTLVNEVKANASWNSQKVYPIGDAWKRDTYGFTFPLIYGGTGGRFGNSIPDVSAITGYALFSGAARSLLSPTTDIQLGDNMTWLHGAHTLKFGVIVVRNRKDQNARSLYAGQVQFSTNASANPNTTGNGFADALLGNFSTYTEAAADLIGLFRFSQTEGFVSDNWRLSQKLSLEAGVRYTLHEPMYTQSNNMTNFDPARYNPTQAVTVNRDGTLVPGSGNVYNGLIRAGSGVPTSELGRVPNGNSPSVLAVPAGAPRGFYHSQNLFAPRFSFAWTPSGRSDAAVRAGVGLFFDRPEGNLLFGGSANGPINSPPYSVSAQYQNGNLASPGGLGAPAPAPIGGIAAIDPNLKVPRTWNWSTSYQRGLPWGIFGEISYVGSKGQNLIRQPDINLPSFADLAANAALPSSQRANINSLRPYKGFSQIYMHLSDGDSNYNAMQAFLSRRQGRLRATLSYTLSRSRDNASGNADNVEEYLNKNYNYGPSDFDRPNIVVGTWTWQLPFLTEQTSALRLLGGWEISGAWRYQSGAPLTVTGNTSIGVRRVDFLGGDPYVPKSQMFDPASPGTVHYLNPTAFAVAPEGRRGNSLRGQFRGPSSQVWDLSLRKRFPVGGDATLQIQADLFNVFNQTELRFSVQSLDTTAGGFGLLNQSAPPRNVQLSARLTF
jgi:carboxypeptidase family protein